MPKTVTRTYNVAGQTTTITEINGVRTTVTKPVLPASVLGDALAAGGYRQHKIWNPVTLAYITVNLTGNEAQDAALLAAAVVTTGDRTTSFISTT